jgi:hypothetical protein
MQALAIFRQKAGAHEESASGDVVELRRVRDVATLISQISGNGRDDPAGRWALNAKRKA